MILKIILVIVVKSFFLAFKHGFLLKDFLKWKV